MEKIKHMKVGILSSSLSLKDRYFSVAYGTRGRHN